MSGLEDALDAIGLRELVHIFRREGFDTWSQLLDISEADLIQCQIKLGHRRRLQRAIQESAGAPPLLPLTQNGQQASRSASTGLDHDSCSPVLQNAVSINDVRLNVSPEQQPITTKRKYRRHPKPDENAPERPPSAYVLFSNRVRERLKDENLSFTEIAKIVGEQWQDPDPRERAACENEAQERKEVFYAELAEYKKTVEYSQYQQYLAEFKAKHSEKNAQVQRKHRSNNHVSPPELSTLNAGVDGLRARQPGFPPYATPHSSSEEHLLDGWHRQPPHVAPESRSRGGTSVSGSSSLRDGFRPPLDGRMLNGDTHGHTPPRREDRDAAVLKADRRSMDFGGPMPFLSHHYHEDLRRGTSVLAPAPHLASQYSTQYDSYVRVLPSPDTLSSHTLGKDKHRLSPLATPALTGSFNTPTASAPRSPDERITLPPIRTDRGRDGMIDWSTGSYPR